MSAGMSPQHLSLLLLKAFIPQHEQHHEIKATEMLFNHFSIVLLHLHLHPTLLICMDYYCAVSSYRILPPKPTSRQ